EAAGTGAANPWAPPTAPAVGDGPGHTVATPTWPAPAPPAGHDRQTAVTMPDAGNVTVPGAPFAGPGGTHPAVPGAGTDQPWTGPFAPPSPAAPSPAGPGGPAGAYPPPYPGATAGGPAGAPGNPFAPPVQGGEPVPPPPIAPDGPGRTPYGYPGGYGYPAQPGYGGAHGPQAPGTPGLPGYYGWPGMPPMADNGMGTAGLVLGILSAIVFCLWPIAIIMGVLGLIFGLIGRRKAKRGEATNGGQALAGAICGGVGIFLGIGMIVLMFVAP
ncbi:DUF4190 domain-containing protein, partial [Streptomyces sp. NPDC002265]|uniref:DUF4190 domain-containing protein n=1 Tax=Streptomyces sp. NPDC002265 TaxID=3154415 RepID=UPI00332EC829